MLKHLSLPPLFAVLLALTTPMLAQRPQIGQPLPSDPVPTTNTTLHPTPEDPTQQSFRERLLRQRNEERQKKLVADTERLLQLVTALHDDVAKTNKDILSLSVVRRAEEIEKLAKSVKERMRDQ